MFFVLSTGTKKKFWVLMKNTPQTFSFCAPMLYHCQPKRLYGKQGSLWSSNMTCVLHTARISNVDIVMFCK